MRIKKTPTMPQAKDFVTNGKFDSAGFKNAVRNFQFCQAVARKKRANSIENFFAA